MAHWNFLFLALIDRFLVANSLSHITTLLFRHILTGGLVPIRGLANLCVDSLAMMLVLILTLLLIDSLTLISVLIPATERLLSLTDLVVLRFALFFVLHFACFHFVVSTS